VARRAFRRGELPLVVLRLLEERELFEGEILELLDGLFGREYRWTPAGMVAALEALEAERLVTGERVRGSGVYRITTDGQAALRCRADAPVLAAVTDWRGEAPAPSHPVSHALEHVAVLFTDVVSSTEMLDRLGDHAAHQLRRRHFSLLREGVGAHGGSEVKNLGDGLMVVFSSVRTAIACGLAMQRAVRASDDPVELRVGIASGEAVHEDHDYFGRPVVVAKRLCDAADPGDLLVSEPPPGVIAGSAARELGPLALKGLSEPVAATAIRPAPLTLVA
jgi:class 3 adenylate cyclase